MTEEQKAKRIHAIVYSCDSREELAERIVKLEDEGAKLRELVLEIWYSCPVSEYDCAKCQHRIEESDEDWCDIPILMEKLGVDVEG